MWTLALRGGARVAVVAAEWCDAFGVVTRGRVQLELRDGEPGPVLGRGAGFWLRGTGVRALRNPGSDFPAVIAALRRGALDAAPFITARIPLDRAVEEGCEGQVKVLVHPCQRPAAFRPGKQGLAT
ncbi:hypothetical protein [Streptomyces sp. NPDC057580]|uniref:hypothetical protein n=1 Tax=Streptomyces sp. NPDC057580 TaxID=3346173 RepID=UPI0036B6B791